MKETNWIHYYCDSSEQITNLDIFMPKEGDIKTVEFNKESFSKLYFDKNVGIKIDPLKITPSNEMVENYFFDNNGLIHKEDWNRIDVLRILAWKTGKIAQKESTRDDFQYADGWEEAILTIQLPNQDRIIIKELADLVIGLRRDYNKNKDANKVWKTLIFDSCIKEVRGLGSVYILTLFSFITGGEYPIYDRFAMAALSAMLLNEIKDILVPQHAIIFIRNLPEKKEEGKLENLIVDEHSLYKQYIRLLNHFFNEDWKKDRKIDQALWTYGHLFSVK